MIQKKTIVITGCSSGFGRATALELARRGWHVFATVRKEADQASLLSEAATNNSQDNLTPLLCDITQAKQIATLAQQVCKLLSDGSAQVPLPGLDALLNNAGTAYGAPLELLPIEDFRAQMELNVTAHLAVTQAFLPMLKVARGTIINVSSVAGRLATPMTGAYSASKFALEALSDTLRIELAPFGVRVVIIEPSSSPTNIWNTSIERSLWLNTLRDGPYGRLIHISEKVARRSSEKGFPAQLFADTVVRILNSPKPHARYPIPFAAATQIQLRRFLHDDLWDGLLRRVLKW
jgi:NAD(P)-dependent dehydrogenase (short-subunit alcohol dehydrogenase family)